MDYRLVAEIYIGIGLILSEPPELSLRGMVGFIVGVLLYPIAIICDKSWFIIKSVLDYFNIRFFFYFFFTKRFKRTEYAHYLRLVEIMKKRKFIRKWTEQFALYLVKRRNKYTSHDNPTN